MDLKEAIRIEITRCIADPIYFANYCYIQHPKRGKIPFALYPYQKTSLMDLMNNRWNIILKSRQLGISTLCALYSLWMALFQEDKNILIIATKTDVAKNMLTKVHEMYNNLPRWLKGKELPSEQNKLSIRFNNGSQIKAVSSAGDSGRSDALSLLIVDEAAFISNFKEKWASIQPTLSTGGQAIVLSTPNGVGNWFHQTWQDAENGKNSWNFIKLHWTVHPERDEKWRAEQNEILGPVLAAQECFDENTRIYTNRGLIPIKDINLNDKVLTHTGEFKKVKHIFYHNAEETYKISSRLNKTERYVTPNHPFLFNNTFTEIDKINDKSLLAYFPKKIKLNNKIKTINVEELLTTVMEIESDGENVYSVDKYKYSISNKIQANYDFGYILGLYLAEGNSARDMKEFTYCYSKEHNTWATELVTKLHNIFPNSRIVDKKRNNMDAGRVRIYNPLVFNLIDCFVKGTSRYKKLIDITYKYESVEFYKGIIDGFFLGDGCTENNNNISCNSTSENLIYDIQYLMMLVGYSNLSINVNETEELFIDSRGSSCKLPSHLRILGTSKIKTPIVSNILNEKISPCSTHDFLEDKKYYYTTINKLELIKERRLVYNIEVEDNHTYVTEHFVVHNCDCSFLSSGNSVVPLDILEHYKELLVKEPLEKRGIDGNYWVWKYPDYSHQYIVSCDVARGDGNDYSTVQVIDMDEFEQVAEYEGKMDTSTFGNMVTAIATEYNNAILAIENTGLGFAAVQSAIDMNYQNIYYSDRMNVIDEAAILRWNNSTNANKVPGFTTSAKTRPYVVSKVELYIREKLFKFYSNRLYSQLQVFLWINGKPQAQTGYNDDLVMALGIGLYLKDTAIRMNTDSSIAAKAMLNSMDSGARVTLPSTGINNNKNPYLIKTQYGNFDTSWLIK